MSETRRHYEIIEAADKRLSQAPNLCGMRDRTTRECRTATIELFTLAINHGFRDGVLAVAADVLTFLSRDEKYVADWGNPGQVSKLVIVAIDAIAEAEIDACFMKWLVNTLGCPVGH